MKVDQGVVDFIFYPEPLSAFEKDVIRRENDLEARKLFQLNLENCRRLYPGRVFILPPLAVKDRFQLIKQICAIIPLKWNEAEV